MSQRKFIIALACLVVTAGGFVLLLMKDKGERVSDALPTEAQISDPQYKKSHRLSLPDTNRFKKLTDSSIPWQVRVDQLRRLDATTLNSSEIDFLFNQLQQPPEGYRKEAWWVILNEIMGQLVKQNIEPARIGREFSSIIKNQRLDPVVRDYAVQHISNYIVKDMAANQESYADIINTMTDVIIDPANQHNSIPGTALMSLIQVSRNSSQEASVMTSFDQLEGYLMPLVEGSSTASIVTRTSAINAVGLMRAEQYIPVLTRLVSDNTTNDSVQLSSIAALGDFFSGVENEPSLDAAVTLLQDIANGHTKFRYAAEAALKKNHKY